ncbi:site-specific integrase [Shimazuella kribbensis]|uniref:site-specific integrase n=1 Tax=Shimazuella kribbensis TaxID=139808 RepID=UPI00048DDE68|nr:site-specific integrase [Shimazuella kribbensis]
MSLTEEMLTNGIKGQREDQKPKLVSTDDIKLVLSSLRRSKRRENTLTARRNYALINFLIGTGLRLGELERLTWADVDFDESLIRINESKARRQQSIPLSEAHARELESLGIGNQLVCKYTKQLIYPYYDGIKQI